MTELNINNPDSFMFSTVNHVTALIDARDDVEQATIALNQSGYMGKGVKILQGPAGAAILNGQGVKGGEIKWLGKLFISTSGDMKVLAQTEKTLLAGGYALAISVHSENQRDQVADILEAHQAYFIIFHGYAGLVQLKVKGQ